MRILHVCNHSYAIPPKKYGGVERYVDWLIRGQVEEGHIVDLIGNEDSTTPCNKLIPYSRHGYGIADFIRSQLHIMGQYDIVHEHGNCGLLGNVKNYLWSNSHSEANLFNKFRNKVQHTKNLALAEGIPSYAGINLGLPVDDIIYNDTKENYMVYTSLASLRHGVDMAIEVALKSKTKLIFIGDFDSGINAEGMERYIKPNLGPYIEVFDLTPFDSVTAELKKQLIVSKSMGALLPTRDTTFGIVLIEALSAGTPCIVYTDSNPASWPPSEIISEGKTGFICKNIDEMVTAVQNLKTIEPRVCRDTAKFLFDYKVMVNNYLALYNDIINNGSTW